MKTDIRGFTTRVESLSESELSNLLTSHKEFIVDIVARHEGIVVKGEGDAFWMTFPSVTAASLAAYEIHEELRFTQGGKGDVERLAVRIVITLGDVLHHENDIFGETVNLAARIESIAPADEIYLSEAAWLALNKTEVRGSYVGEFTLKGIADSVEIYKLDREHRTRIVKDHIIMFTDVEGYSSFTNSHSIEDVERLLIHHELIHIEACEEFGGTLRQFLGDACFITFPNSELALSATEKLFNEWEEFVTANDIACSLKVGMHKGDIYLFRSYMYGKDIYVTSRLGDSLNECSPLHVNRAVVSDAVMNDVVGSEWEHRLKEVQLPNGNSIKGVSRTFMYTVRINELAV